MFFWVEQFFCVFFVVELGIRFLAFSNKCKSMREFWFLFDFFLVLSMVIQARVWVKQSARCCRNCWKNL